MIAGKTMLALVAAGWLAEALASTHADIDAGVAAYNAGDSDAALEQLHRRRGRPRRAPGDPF
jgi:NADH:ubiquinone oxidoreductase subunit F (NADH-binding)